MQHALRWLSIPVILEDMISGYDIPDTDEVELQHYRRSHLSSYRLLVPRHSGRNLLRILGVHCGRHGRNGFLCGSQCKE